MLIREPEWEQHRLLKSPNSDVNLHVFSVDAREWRRHLLFRDWLRTCAEDRQRYAEHKRALARRTWEFTQDYTNAKHDLIAEILDRAFAADLAAHPELAVDVPD